MVALNLEKNEKKFNIFLGEFLSKLTNVPTTPAISKELFSFRKKDYVLIKNNLSLPELTQNLLDDIIFEKSEILEILNEIFSNKSKFNSNFLKSLLDSNLFSTIISTNYDFLFEDYFFDTINKNTPFLLETPETDKVNFYKIFGDLNIPDKFILSTQDIKRIKILAFYEAFWKNIRNELCKNPTLLFAVNLEDTVFLDILNFIFSKIKKQHKKIYLYTNEDIKSEQAKDFLETYSVTLIKGDYEDFFKNIEIEFPEFKKNSEISEKEISEEKKCDIKNSIEEIKEEKENQEIVDIIENENTQQNNFPQLPFGIVKTSEENLETQKNENNNKIEFKEFHTEKNPIFLKLEDKYLLETASEIKFKTLFLDKFPIKYRNFSKILKPVKITNLGSTDVDFGFEILNSVQIKLIEYPKFKMLEFRKRDFKFAIGINAEGTILLRSNDLFEYEIYRDTKNIRLRVILEFFKKLFAGSSIKFHLSNVICDFDFVNHIEEFKFNNILEILSNYENLVKIFGLHRNKDLASNDNSFYSLSLLDAESKNSSIDTWINLKMDNHLKLEVGDKLILIREYNYQLKNLPFILLEKIEVKNVLTEKELLNNKIELTRKTVKISFEKIKK